MIGNVAVVLPDLLLALGALVVMEPLTALIHRFVMHGFGMGWHRSHHLPPRATLEANDLFPVVFALATIALLSIGIFGGVDVLVPLGCGITAYGAGYLLVHDVVIHRRLGSRRLPPRVGRRLRAAHNIHHLFSAAPYGFLCPVVPHELRDRAAAAATDRTTRTV
jgi:beta-carotene 3-hydroxylase